MTLGLLRFESFTLDLERLTLNGPAGPANLRRKSFDVLRYLAERAGRVVTKEELIKAIWPDVTVGDESLTKCISEARQAIGDEGQSVIKTIPRRGYLFDAPIAPADIPASGATADAIIPDRPSIAVLPFANMSGDSHQEYISDGIVEDIITELSRFSGLFVIARNSSFQWKGKTVDARQVGRDLGVRYLLEGSVRRAGERIRISTQLINAESGNHLWAERYDRDVQDVFAVQDEVARTVAAILAAHVTKAEAERTVLKPPKSWQAYDHYMRAAEVHATFHRAMQVTALYETRELLDRCLAMEPGFARAHVLYSATLVTTWTLALDSDHRNPPVLENALRWAEKAVQLDPNLPEAHAQLGYALGYMGKPDAAVAEFRARDRAQSEFHRLAICRCPRLGGAGRSGHRSRECAFARRSVRATDCTRLSRARLSDAAAIPRGGDDASGVRLSFAQSSPRSLLAVRCLCALGRNRGGAESGRACSSDRSRFCHDRIQKVGRVLADAGCRARHRGPAEGGPDGKLAVVPDAACRLWVIRYGPI